MATILWHDTNASNETQLWFMDGHRIVNRQTVLDEAGNPILIARPWRIVGAADFNGNGNADILWHDTNASNATHIWFMDGHRIVNRQTVLDEAGNPILIARPWRIVGAADFNGNGNADILWHDTNASNATHIWFMDGHRIVNRQTVLDEAGNPILIARPWQIVPSRGADYLDDAEQLVEDLWNAAGGPMSNVGLPIGGKIAPYSVDGVATQADFRSGSIKVLHHDPQPPTIEWVPGDWVRIWWVGLECAIRQEAEDEVYGTVFCHGPGRSANANVVIFPGGNETLKMGKQGARLLQTNQLLYEGPLVNVTLGATLIENDSGDVEEISRQVADKLQEASAAFLGGLTGASAEAVSNQTWYKEGIGSIAGLFLDDVFGIGDDAYLPVSKLVQWETLASFPQPSSYRRPGEPQVISAYNEILDASGVDDAGDIGHYRFFFLYEHANPPG